jgi:hypothetical protein
MLTYKTTHKTTPTQSTHTNTVDVTAKHSHPSANIHANTTKPTAVTADTKEHPNPTATPTANPTTPPTANPTATPTANPTAVVSTPITLKSVYRHTRAFLVAAIPLVFVFAAHECASTGYFLHHALHCRNLTENSQISPAWSRIWLVFYYYVLSKYCIFIEPRDNLIKA